MSNLRKSLPAGLLAVLCLSVLFSMTALAAEETAEYVPAMYATFWALVPPIVAIGLALSQRRFTALCSWESSWARCSTPASRLREP